ncbi:hypothetical protein GGS21DRAFT_491796 [Xylaria nigripes]|nr:hypothetical protein GGS21DRAFT_491796 [Xylaria nigripes]
MVYYYQGPCWVSEIDSRAGGSMDHGTGEMVLHSISKGTKAILYGATMTSIRRKGRAREEDERHDHPEERSIHVQSGLVSVFFVPIVSPVTIRECKTQRTGGYDRDTPYFFKAHQQIPTQPKSTMSRTGFVHTTSPEDQIRSRFVSDEDYEIYLSIKDDQKELPRLRSRLKATNESMANTAIIRSNLRKMSDRVVHGLERQLELVNRMSAELDENTKNSTRTPDEVSELRMDLEMRIVTLRTEIRLVEHMLDERQNTIPNTPDRGGKATQEKVEWRESKEAESLIKMAMNRPKLDDDMVTMSGRAGAGEEEVKHPVLKH